MNMKMLNRLRRDSRGFSLIDLMISGTFIVLVSSFSMFFTSRALSSYRLESDARGIATTLMMAKFRSASQATSYRVVFDASSNSYSVQRSSGSGFANEGSSISLSQNIVLSSAGLASAPVEPCGISGQSGSVAFNVRGLPIDASGSPTPNNAIYLNNAEGERFAVTVSLAGHVQTWKWNGSGWVLQ